MSDRGGWYLGRGVSKIRFKGTKRKEREDGALDPGEKKGDVYPHREDEIEVGGSGSTDEARGGKTRPPGAIKKKEGGSLLPAR